jgi:hypothetical protein
VVYSLNSSLTQSPFLEDNIRTGKLRLVVDFTAPTDVDLSMGVYVEVPQTITIDKKLVKFNILTYLKANLFAISFSLKVEVNRD